MRFHSCISDEENTDDAIEAIVDSARDATDDHVDVLFVFFTPHHREEADRIVESLWLELDPQCAIGCSAEGVIGDAIEIERSPGIAVLVGSLPGVRMHPFHIAGPTAWREVTEDRDAFGDRMGIGKETAAVIALGDPFSTPLDPFLAALEANAPRVPLIGGMSSGGRQAGENRLARNDEIFDAGMVGVTLSGPLAVQTVVSQGCRPIGEPLIVTRGHDNVIEQLGGKPALAVMQEVISALIPAEQQLLENGLMIGRAISEYREQFGRGDFLVRNVIAVDEDKGFIALAGAIRTGQTVQFHVRDAVTASEDLQLLLEPQKALQPAAGGLLVSCNGRGSHLFGRPGHDISVARRTMPNTPVAGFFAAGEFGPVGDRNFIHGHTASLAMFRPKG